MFEKSLGWVIIRIISSFQSHPYSMRIQVDSHLTNRLIGKDVSHRKPYVLALGRVEQKLLTLPLRVVKPVSGLTVVHKGTFHVDRWWPLNKFASLRWAKVPHGLNVLMFGQVFSEVIAVPCDDVYNTTGQVWCVKNLQKGSEKKKAMFRIMRFYHLQGKTGRNETLPETL